MVCRSIQWKIMWKWWSTKCERNQVFDGAREKLFCAPKSLCWLSVKKLKTFEEDNKKQGKWVSFVYCKILFYHHFVINSWFGSCVSRRFLLNGNGNVKADTRIEQENNSARFEVSKCLRFFTCSHVSRKKDRVRTIVL